MTRGLENDIIKKILAYELLSERGVLVVEHSSKVKIKALDFDEDNRTCGSTVLSFLSYGKEIVNNE